MTSAIDIKDELFATAVPGKQEILSSFYKTGPGDYAEGDVFIGVPIPAQRSIVKTYQEMDLDEIHVLLGEEYHECRSTALLFLVHQFETGKTESVRKEIFNFYLAHTHCINNWDLVDLSAPQIVGSFLTDKERDVLYRLAESKSLWEKRIAIVATLTFIKKGDFDDTLKIAERLLSSKESLLQKATGWMLREVGKRDYTTEYEFLKNHYNDLSRTTLRYAIERFDEPVRKSFLKGEL